MPIARINGINISYSTEGLGESLILIGGLGASQSIWAPQVATFKKYYRVITFDNRGSGRSERQIGPYTLKTLADDTAGLMDFLGIKQAVILGVSMGGAVAQEIVLSYPDRVSELILGCTYAGIDKACGGPTEELIQLRARSSSYKSPSAALGIPFLRLAYNRPLYKWPVLARIWLRSIFRRPKKNNGSKPGFVLPDVSSITNCNRDRLPAIRVSTLVIAGSRDRVVKPESSGVIASLIPNSKLVIIKNGSHFFHVEMSRAFNREVLKFLKGNK
jgi:3-oxoadipate enol-lactonase